MENNRTAKAIKNVKISILTYIVIIILQFANRSIFVGLLSDEYLGLNGLFSNVLQFLALAELGIGSAMSYALYRPLNDNDVPLLKSYMKFYQKAYFIIGIVVLVMGLALTPFLSFFIKDMPENMPLLPVYYILYVVNSAASYFYTYKRTILVCDQKQYISSITTSVKTILTAVLQIVVLLITHDFLFYLVVMIVCTVAENIVVSRIADRQYPFLREKEVEPLAKDRVHDLTKNVSAMFLHKIGTVIVTSTDNLIISKFVSLSMSGLYSNYTMVTNALNSLLNQVFTSVTASVGNLVANDDPEHDEAVLKNVLFANFWIYSFCSVCLFCLFEPFIQVWLGDRYEMGLPTVAVIVAVFYLTGVRKTVLTFRDAAGIFWYDRYKSLVEAGVNLACSIPLAIRFGVVGTLVGTVISTVCVSFWVEARVLYKHHFHKSRLGYYAKQALYAAITVLCAGVTYKVTTLIGFTGIFGLLVKAVICLIVPNLMVAIMFCWTAPMKYFMGLGKKAVMKYAKRK